MYRSPVISVGLVHGRRRYEYPISDMSLLLPRYCHHAVGQRDRFVCLLITVRLYNVQNTAPLQLMCYVVLQVATVLFGCCTYTTYALHRLCSRSFYLRLPAFAAPRCCSLYEFCLHNLSCTDYLSLRRLAAAALLTYVSSLAVAASSHGAALRCFVAITCTVRLCVGS